MKIRLDLKGTKPLLMSNPRMADNDYAVKRELQALTSKRTKTDADLREIARLEWIGGVYDDLVDEDGHPVLTQPTSKPRKAIIEAARRRKLGKAVEEALAPLDVHVPLQYIGSRRYMDMLLQPEYTNRSAVVMKSGAKSSRVMKVRPSFYPWALSVPAVLAEDTVDLDDFVEFCYRAGEGIGIGDNRKNGYGRFEIEVWRWDTQAQDFVLASRPFSDVWGKRMEAEHLSAVPARVLIGV